MTVDCSVIIPVYNGWSLTEACLRSVRNSLQGVRIEVVVVDNASFDETPRALSEDPAVIPVRHDRNLGFARACNAGAARATGRLLLFLNNDTFVFPGAIDSMVASYRAAPSIGVLGARLLYADHTVQHAGMAMDNALNWHHVFRGLSGEHPLVLVKRSFQAVTGACLMIARELFHEMGGFDEGFLNSHEDVDLCLRVRARGLEVVYEPSAMLLHYESMSDGRTLASLRGAERFRQKWSGKVSADLAEKTVTFADRQVALLDGQIRELLASDRSPLRVPREHWGTLDEARRYSELVRARDLCAAHAKRPPALREHLGRLLEIARRHRGS